MTYDIYVPDPTVFKDLHAAIGLTGTAANHVRIEALDKNGEAILIGLHPEVYGYQTPGSPWRFKCTIIYGFAEGMHVGSFFLQDGKVYVDVERYDLYAYDQVVKVQNSMVPVLSKNAKLEALIKSKRPDIHPIELSAQVAGLNVIDALDAKHNDGRHAQFYLDKTSGRMDAQLTLTPIPTQIPGRPWVFAVDVQTGWFKIKSGTVYCENGMLHFHIDGRAKFCLPQKNQVQDVLFPA